MSRHSAGTTGTWSVIRRCMVSTRRRVAPGPALGRRQPRSLTFRPCQRISARPPRRQGTYHFRQGSPLLRRRSTRPPGSQDRHRPIPRPHDMDRGGGYRPMAAEPAGETTRATRADWLRYNLKRPANPRNGRSALVTSPGGAATTERIALRAGIPVTVIPIEAKFAGSDRSTPGLGKIMCLLYTHGITLDLSDVAALDIPTGIGVRRHLPLQVRLDARYAVDDALILDVVAAEGTLRQQVPAEVDVLGARAEFVAELDLVELQAEAVGHHETLSANTRVYFSNLAGMLGSSTGSP